MTNQKVLWNIILVLCCTIGISGFCQSAAVEGSIIDAFEENFLSNVTVTSSDGKISVESDSEGKFRMII